MMMDSGRMTWKLQRLFTHESNANVTSKSSQQSFNQKTTGEREIASKTLRMAPYDFYVNVITSHYFSLDQIIFHWPTVFNWEMI